MNDFLDRHRAYLKYLFLLSLITFVILFVARAAHGAWYSDWNYRKKITIQSSRVSGGPHSNFPVLIKLASDTELAADAQETGDDILFTTADGETKIPHEIESFNGSTGALVAWVRVGSVSSSSNTDIYMYYGKFGVGDQQNPTGVWDSNYKGVWHLDESVNDEATTGTHYDSTANNNDGTQYRNNDTTGKIDVGQDFDGSDYISVAHNTGLNLTSGLTLEAWVNLANSGNDQKIVGKTENVVCKSGYILGVISGHLYAEIWNSLEERKSFSSGTISSNKWTHLALTWTTGGNMIGYVNGSPVNTISAGSNNIRTDSTNPLYIGVAPYNHSQYYVNGDIDEVRVSATARSGDWIKTEYNNQVWPNTAVTPSPLPDPNPEGGFITVDSYESQGGENQPPVADAGANQDVSTGATVALDGSGSSDPDGDSLTYSWSFVGKPGGSSATLSSSTAVNPTFTADVSGTYTLQLIVNDGSVNSAPDTVVISASTLDLSGYSCNMKISIDNTKVSGNSDLEDFPALISLTEESLKTSGTGCGFVVNSDGCDIIFTDGAKSQQLDHEIERYDGSTGELIAWVRVPTLKWNEDTDLYVYFGNDSVSCPQENPTGVWDSDYVVVQHMDGDSASALDDSTSNHNDVTGSGSSPSYQSDGRIGYAVGFDGYNDYVEIADGSSTFSNTGYISIPSSGSASPYPSQITVSGVTGTVAKVTVKINDLSHTNPDDIDMLLVGPTGQTVMLMSDQGGGGDVSGVDLTFDDSAASELPDYNQIYSGTYKPCVSAQSDYMSGAPSGPYGTVLSGFNGLDPNGTWSLYIRDDNNYNSGTIANGWELNISGQSTLDITAAVTVSAWIRPTDIDAWERIVTKSHSAESAPWTMYGLMFNDANRLLAEISDGSSNYAVASSSTVPTNGSWTYATLTYNGSTLAVYFNDQSPNTTYHSGSINTNNEPFSIARSSWGGDYFTGRIDEVRISKIARSADWIKTEYNNQSNPSSFAPAESPQCPETTPSIAEYSCSIPIAIKHGQVSGDSDLTDFPVLISLTNTALKTTENCGHVQNDNGYDIIFSNATQTTQLDHEVEKYDGTTGELVAWVRIPTLQHDENTLINLHFGNSDVCGPPGNPQGVWDSNYKGVWHLNESGTGVRSDSTSNGNHGNPSGYDGNEATSNGKIAGADHLGGTDDYIASANNIGISGDDKRTVTFWAELDDTTRCALVEMGTNTCNGEFSISVRNDLYLLWGYCPGNDSPTNDTPATGSFHHHAIIHDGTTTRWYVDTTQIHSFTHDWNTTDNPVHIGHEADGSTHSYLAGTMDEVRISNTDRSLDWIKTSYNNQNNPGNFIDVGQSTCFLAGFSCNRKLTIDHTKVEGSTALDNFPVLIQIEDDCNLRTTENDGSVESSNGYDIIFIDSDGVTQLDHELEKYDGDDGELTAWVKIPSLSPTTDTDIYMYYGNSDYAACDPSNPAGVWSNNYRGVWHLQDQNNLEDSTSYNNDGTAQGGVNDDTGKIVGGQYFDGGSDYISVPDATSLDITTELTMEVWVNLTNASNNQKVVGKTNSTYTSGYLIGVDDGLYPEIWDDDWQNENHSFNAGSISSSQWTHLATTWKTGGNMIGYINGSEVHTESAGSDDIDTNSGNLIIGAAPWDPTTFEVTGTIDEVRISSEARSADWLETEYNNQNEPSKFFSMSEDSCGGSYGFNYRYCKKLTVDYSQVSSNLADFPLLINLTGDSDLKAVGQGGRVETTQGYDIVFRDGDSCGPMDHEIEKYDGDAGDLVAWVRVETLSADKNNPTEIYMYYGDSQVNCPTENPDGVWDGNYKGVWHLDETPANGVAGHDDSTGNSNDGTPQGFAGAAGSTTNATGQIDGADEFDGSNDHITIPYHSSLHPSTAITFEAWLKWDDNTASEYGAVIHKAKDTDTIPYVSYSLEQNYTNQTIQGIVTVSNTSRTAGPVSLSEDAWHHLVATWSSGDRVRLYIDGSQAAQSDSTYTGTITYWNTPLGIGQNVVTVGNTTIDGNIDEVRVSSTARTADWIMTQYKNQSDPGNFYTIGSCFDQTTTMGNTWEEDF